MTFSMEIEKKCGEVYFANDIFHLSCNCCSIKFKKVKIFIQHFVKKHIHLNIELIDFAIKQFFSETEDCAEVDLNSKTRNQIKPNQKFNVTIEGSNNCVDQENNHDTVENCVEKFENSFEEDIDSASSSEHEQKCTKVDEKLCGTPSELISNLENDQIRNSVEQIVNGEVKRRWICRTCNQTFSRRDNMLRHKWNVHKEKLDPTKEIRLDCKWCGQHFKRHSDRSRHENKQHTADGTKLNRRKDYKKNPGERYVCETCGNSYKHSYTLIEHRRVHTGERPYKCEICGATFAKKQNFAVHQQYHSGIRRYKCQYCEKAFVQKTKLILHEMVHTGTYTAQCNICNKPFRCQSRLKVHIKRHLNERQYKCDTCEKRFFTGDSLKRHQALHSDIRPFHCFNCPAKYATKCSLQKHIKRRHRQQDTTTEVTAGITESTLLVIKEESVELQ